MRALACLLIALLPAGSLLAAEPGEPAPQFSLPGLREQDGTAVSLQDFRGQVIYLDFWASWCPPCKLSLPLLDAMHADYQQAGKDFAVLAINVDSDPADGLDFLLDVPVRYAVLEDPAGSSPAAYQLRGMPTGYLIDRSGTVRLVHEGFKRSDIEMLKKEIDSLLEEP